MTAPATAPDPSTLPPLQRGLLHLLALGASPRPRTWVFQQQPYLDLRNETGRRATQEDVRAALQDLVAQGWLAEDSPRGPGYYLVAPARGALAYDDLLSCRLPGPLRQLLWRESGMDMADSLGRLVRSFPNQEAAVAQTRLELFSGINPTELNRLRGRVGWSGDWDRIFELALSPIVGPRLFSRLHPALQGTVLASGLATVRAHWVHGTGFDTAGLIAAAKQWLKDQAVLTDTPGGTHSSGSTANRGTPLMVLLLLAETLLLTGDPEGLSACLNALYDQQDEEPEFALSANLLKAVDAGYEGRWEQAQDGFESVLPVLRKLTQRRKGLLPDTLATSYILALLAQGGHAHLQQALKFCRAEGGKVSGEPESAWATMALAVQMRLGEVPREPKRLRVYSRAPRAYALDWWSWLMRAWLAERDDAQHPARRLSADDERAYETLRAHLQAVGLQRPLAQLEAAHAVLHQQTPAINFFVPPPQEGWQVALAALASIGCAPEAASTKASEAAPMRLWWVLSVDDQGLLRLMTPMEQKHGTRGWGKPKEVPLARLAKGEGLAASDVAVARCIQPVAHERYHRIDLPTALSALVGHPRVAFHDAPDRAVQLVEAAPELEVIELGPDLLVRLKPPPVVGDPYDDDLPLSTESGQVVYFKRTPTAAERKEREALRYLRVLRDEPQRARLVRYSAAQRQVAQLVGLGLTVPRAAASQLQAVIASLGAHFQIQGDELQASREVPHDSRLRAELTPATSAGPDGLTLRLVVAPLGAEGPRLPPGSGRARLIARVAGETLGVQRDLAAERGHLNTTMEACPMLGPLPPVRHEGQVVPAVWEIENPEASLALVERLHTLQAVAALDWPKGKPIRVDTAGLPQLKVQVQSGAEWLALDGAVTVDESLVVTLSKLLDWSASNRSRFVALGEGRYLALTEELRARLDELRAVGEAGPAVDADGAADGATALQTAAGNAAKPTTARGRAKPGRWGSSGGAWRVPAVAAGWLAQTLEGASTQTDEAWRDRLEWLVRAQNWHPELPSTLQAELRPYQVEGYRWLMRLAQAGLGAVLADDMGLGKTLQATAVMLERAAGGAALVVAPTSLMGNWADELRRFAPSLTVHTFAEGDRESLIAATGAGEVVLITYQLLWLHAEALSARRWHTLVLDEAQSIKNAAAKRTQAAFDLQADFRIALSGTPIENRLAELWAIMRVCNPGLLGSQAQFQSRFAIPIERDRQTPPRRILRRLIAPFVLRRTKAQVLDDLPPRTELVLRVQGNETEVAHYEALRRQAMVESQEALSGRVVGQAHFNILAQLTRLRRAACDPRLVTPDLQQPGAKVQAFGDLAAELVANGHKALVFSQFVDFLHLLKEPLDAAGIAYQYLDGSTPAAERQARVAAFQAGQGDLFLISLKAGGFGLNLTVADYVVIADPWWNPAAEDQASGRAHRIGQQRPVTVYRLVNSGTLEERIVALHDSKRELSEAVLSAEGDAAALGPLKADELLALMRPTQPSDSPDA